MIQDLEKWEKTFEWDSQTKSNECNETSFDYYKDVRIVASATHKADTNNYTRRGWVCNIFGQED